MWNYIFLSFFICIIATTFLHWLFYDLLIKIESTSFPLDWEKDGKPYGMFYKPLGSRTFQGIVKGMRKSLLTKWVFKKPKWVLKDEEAEKYYQYFRLAGISNFSFTISFVALLVVTFFIQP